MWSQSQLGTCEFGFEIGESVRREGHRSSTKTAIATLAGFPGKTHPGLGLGGLL